MPNHSDDAFSAQQFQRRVRPDDHPWLHDPDHHAEQARTEFTRGFR
ncbi:hypothetical protein [Streptomyces sp. AK04-3B]|nr:hypothetical protein [Streptomyces sp. AK04-3B]MDX3800038.1 hypothetical protein [Streptomyces sp. AK04-3B]